MFPCIVGKMYLLLTLFQLAIAIEDLMGHVYENEDTIECESVYPETDLTYCDDPPKTCKDSKYRSYDGSCNNLEHSWWGTPYTPYLRSLSCNSYADGVYEFPKGLPNPRTVSLSSYVDIYKPDPLWTIIFMQYGQIIAHDMSLTAGVAQTKQGAVVCCSEGQLTEAAKTDQRCAPIEVPKNDPYNAPEGQKCMDFYRTETTRDGRKCTNVPEVAEQLTAVTGYLDISYIYGSDNETAAKMREHKGGRLASDKRNGKEFLTQDPNPTLTCNIKDPEELCLYAGDKRVNQNPQLALLHVIYLLEHNSIADALAKVNPHWDDETLYQESRRIMIAKHQHVIYYEFLVPLLGKQNMIDNKLIYPNETGFVYDYDPNVNAGISNEFATAAYRLFHTEIQGLLGSFKDNRNITNLIRLSDWFDRPSVCEHAKNYVGLTIGMATQPQSAVDRYHTNEVTELLFKQGYVGQDLKAIDIQRGRDHGLCGYAQTLKILGLSDPQSFEDFTKFIKKEYVDILKDLYSSYKDVDLVVGISLENLVPGALCGPTAQKILTDQFKRTRVGDRCFYENGNGECAFTIEQLKEIRKSSIAAFLCYNKGVRKMQGEAFKVISKKNPLKYCRDLLQFNPKPWKEKN